MIILFYIIFLFFSVVCHLIRVTNFRDASSLRLLGFDAASLRLAGFSDISIVTAGYTAAELRDANFSTEQLRQAGLTDSALRVVGFQTEQQVRLLFLIVRIFCVSTVHCFQTSCAYLITFNAAPFFFNKSRLFHCLLAFF